jgi:hypothetical protein
MTGGGGGGWAFKGGERDKEIGVARRDFLGFYNAAPLDPNCFSEELESCLEVC